MRAHQETECEQWLDTLTAGELAEVRGYERKLDGVLNRFRRSLLSVTSNCWSGCDRCLP